MEVVMKDKRKAYEEKLDAQLNEWNAQITLLNPRKDYYAKQSQNTKGLQIEQP